MKIIGSHLKKLVQQKKQAKEKIDEDRRRFILSSTWILGGFGLACVLTPFVSSWLPSAKVKTQGGPVLVDLTRLQPGEQMIVQWRKKPVWIIRRTKEMLHRLDENNELLRDPLSVVEQQPSFAKNKYRSLNPEYLVLIGVCTHLGCSPKYMPNLETTEIGSSISKRDSHWPGGFICPCHGSTFDLSGRVFKGVPAPINLEVPPYYFASPHTIVIGQDH